MKIKVIIVDDSVLARKMISRVLDAEEGIEVINTAATGNIALKLIKQQLPDLITMDVEMPGMDGIETVREIKKLYPKIPIIMYSSLTKQGAVATINALNAGASDYVTKPESVHNALEGIHQIKTQLVGKIHALARPNRMLSDLHATMPEMSQDLDLKRDQDWNNNVDLLCVGASTGGPNALATLLEKLPLLNLPIALVQHMPATFTAFFAKRLNEQTKYNVELASHGTILKKNHLYVAPGGQHMEISYKAGQLVTLLNENPPENSCRPAVDVLFRSASASVRKNLMGVILTGMGKDGFRGCEHIRANKGYVISQDKESSVVWGMPGYVSEAGLAHKILPIHNICAEIIRRVNKSS